MRIYELLMVQEEERNNFFEERKISLNQLQQQQLNRYYQWLDEANVTRSRLREIIKERNAWSEEWDDTGTRMAEITQRQHAEFFDCVQRECMRINAEKTINKKLNI